MALLTPLWMQPVAGDPDITYSAAQDRAGLLGAVFSREGVLDKDAGHLRVTQRAEGANFSVDVAAGRCAIVGRDVSDQGSYVCTSTTKVNLPLPGKPASGSRTHRIVAQVRDKNANGFYTTYDWILQVLPDVGGGTPNTPNSALSLGTVTVSSAATSVTNANITEGTGDRKRASIGTPWLTGDIIASGIHSVYSGRDPNRPLTWTKNPDGWVFLAGWFSRTGGDTPLAANVTYPLDGSVANTPGTAPILPPEIRPTSIRDMVGITSIGPLHFAVYPSGTMSFRSEVGRTLVSNSWMSLDGMSFRANAFS